MCRCVLCQHGTTFPFYSNDRTNTWENTGHLLSSITHVLYESVPVWQCRFSEQSCTAVLSGVVRRWGRWEAETWWRSHTPLRTTPLAKGLGERTQVVRGATSVLCVNLLRRERHSKDSVLQNNSCASNVHTMMSSSMYTCIHYVHI